jgi:hypothetical protein
MRRKQIIWYIAANFILAFSLAASEATIFTLSDEALMLLDCTAKELYSSQMTASVIGVHDVPGPGVEFDMHYPGNEWPDFYIELASSIRGGNGDLTGIDISSYDAFALQFTLLSIDDSSSPGIINPIRVGAVINLQEYTSAYNPKTLRLSGPTSDTSITSTDAQQIETVGFTAHIPYFWYDENNPNPWNPNGCNVTLLVKPAAEAVVIPEPVSLSLLLLGGVVVVKRRKKY